MKRFFFTITGRTPAGWGLWLPRQAGRGQWLLSGSQSWTLLMPNLFFFLAVGGRGVENLFEACFGFVSNKREVVVL